MTLVDALHDPLLSSAIYSEAEVARMLALPPSTLRRWTRGYNYKTVDGWHESKAMVTTARQRYGKTIPFIGLVEASLFARVRALGVPIQRLRPGIEELQRRTGLIAALMSEQVKTDGVELLWDHSLDAGIGTEQGSEPGELEVLRSGQIVFREVVEDHLETLEYQDGLARLIRLPRWGADVVADPAINGGQPTLRARGLRVLDVLDRAGAGESPADIAEDLRLDERVVQQLLSAA